MRSFSNINLFLHQVKDYQLKTIFVVPGNIEAITTLKNQSWLMQKKQVISIKLPSHPKANFNLHDCN